VHHIFNYTNELARAALTDFYQQVAGLAPLTV
jgi:hypothetical protein